MLYENFLTKYDPALRRKSGVYYTPAPIVSFMTRFVDDILRERLGRRLGFAEGEVIVVDPAMGTDSFLADVINRVAKTVSDEEGPGLLFDKQARIPVGQRIVEHSDALVRREAALGVELDLGDDLDQRRAPRRYGVHCGKKIEYATTSMSHGTSHHSSAGVRARPGPRENPAPGTDRMITKANTC
jgi:N-6 DNA Methylase